MPYKAQFAANEHISTRGFGKPGFCSLCSVQDVKTQKALTSLYREGQKAPAINAFLLNNVGKEFDRRTIYRHREHVKHPRDRLVNAVQAREARDGTLPAEVSEDEFLRAVVQLANQTMRANPDAVTVDQGMKAATALAAAKQSRQQGINLLVMTLTRGLEDTPMLLRSGGDIEGEYMEVPGG